MKTSNRKKNVHTRIQRPLIDGFRPPIFSYILGLKKELADCETVLDVGCGIRSPISYFPFEQAVGIELDYEALQQAKELRTHHEFVHGDVLKLRQYFKPKQFDCCVCLDVIEHVTREQGLQLIKDMSAIARKKVIICTPNGFMHQKDEKHPLQDHHSGWTTADFKNAGCEVYGILGPKFLRSEQHVYKTNRFIGFVLSEILQYVYTKSRPETAAALMAIKHLD